MPLRSTLLTPLVTPRVPLFLIVHEFRQQRGGVTASAKSEIQLQAAIITKAPAKVIRHDTRCAPGQLQAGLLQEPADSFLSLRERRFTAPPKWQGRVQAGKSVQLQYRLGIEGDVPPGSAVTNQAQLHWWDDELEAQQEFGLEPATVRVSLPAGAYMIGLQGGQFQHSYGITLTVPAHAVQETTRFQFKPHEGDEPEPSPSGWEYAHRAFEMQAFQFGEMHQFNQPLEIAIQYGDPDVAGLIRNSLRLWHRAGPNAPWEMVGEPKAHQYGLIKFETDHFSEFALFGQAAYQVHLPLIVSK